MATMSMRGDGEPLSVRQATVADAATIALTALARRAMPLHDKTDTRYGSLALGLSALLLAVFPIIRPFFPLDPRAPAETLAVASPAITSTSWVVSHLLGTLAFVLLVYGMLSPYAVLASTVVGIRARWAMVLSLAGIALILPMLGVETYMLPVLGRLYLAGQSGVATAIGMIYLGSALFVFLLGLLLLAIGAITFGVAIWRSASLPRWAGVLFALGLVLWFPPFPRTVRVIDGLVIGLGGVWLAVGLGYKTQHCSTGD